MNEIQNNVEAFYAFGYQIRLVFFYMLDNKAEKGKTQKQKDKQIARIIKSKLFYLYLYIFNFFVFALLFIENGSHL